MDNAERLRRPPLWLAPLARLAAFVTAAVVLSRTAGEDEVPWDMLLRLVLLGS